MRKRISVQTNDPKHSRVELTIVGKVKGYLNLSPRFVRLIGTQGKDIKQMVKIMPTAEFPFKILSVKARDGKDIDFKLQPLGKDPRREGYELIVRNKRTDQGYYHDNIIIQTDLKKMPTVTIPVMGRILKARDQSAGKL